MVRGQYMIAAALGAAAVTAAGAIAGYRLMGDEPRFAEVIAVEPVTETVSTPRDDCRDEAVTRRQPTRDPNQVTGTIAGAVVGGVVGSQFGSGSGKKAATAAGAVAGGYAGNKIQEQMQAGNTYTTTERRCRTVAETRSRTVGYDVTYRIGEREGVIRMDQPPAGSRLPVRDGEVVPDPSRTRTSS